MITILSPGIQATLQGAPRTGLRHFGVPASGPADPLSMALANHLVGEAPSATAIEITLGDFEVRFESPALFALAGAPCPASLDGKPAAHHATLAAEAGSILTLAPPTVGVRTYLAVAGAFTAQTVFRSTSTCLPARFGGHQGRALVRGDAVGFGPERSVGPHTALRLETPVELRPAAGPAFALRTVASAEAGLATPASADQFYGTDFTVAGASDRTGVRLAGERIEVLSNGRMKSAAVFPGVVQCPPDGRPIVLGPDAQTTGGYPRIACVARCDRHLIGQLRPGARVRFLRRTETEAIADLAAKRRLVRRWMTGFDF